MKNFKETFQEYDVAECCLQKERVAKNAEGHCICNLETLLLIIIEIFVVAVPKSISFRREQNPASTNRYLH